jgi:hypothetical protein
VGIRDACTRPRTFEGDSSDRFWNDRKTQPMKHAILKSLYGTCGFAVFLVLAGMAATGKTGLGMAWPVVMTEGSEIRASETQETGESAESSDRQTPEWLDDAHAKDRHDHIYVVQTQPCGTEHQASEELQAMIRQTVVQHLTRFIPREQASRLVQFLGSELDAVIFENRQSILPYQDENIRKVATDFELDDSNFYKGYAQLDFTDEFVNDMLKQYEELRLRDRLIGLGLASIGLIGSIGVLFGYLRLNHATRGLHSKRLGFLAVLGMGGLAAIVWWLFQATH